VEQFAEADQVVRDHVQTKHRCDLCDAAQFELAQSAPLLLLRRRLRLDPGKHLLDAPAGRAGWALNYGTAARLVQFQSGGSFAEHDALEIAFCTHSIGHWSEKLCLGLIASELDSAVRHSAPGRHGRHRSASRFCQLSSAQSCAAA